MSAELLPCPFCGHQRPIFERLGSPRQSCIVVCGNCGCRHESSDEGDQSGQSWNDRVPMQAKKAEIAALKEDAERYRWLRDHSVGQWERPIVVDQRKVLGRMQYIGPMMGHALDAAIDSARALAQQDAKS
jgi:Lar family restriction alleviation protein